MNDKCTICGYDHHWTVACHKAAGARRLAAMVNLIILLFLCLAVYLWMGREPMASESDCPPECEVRHE